MSDLAIAVFGCAALGFLVAVLYGLVAQRIFLAAIAAQERRTDSSSRDDLSKRLTKTEEQVSKLNDKVAGIALGRGRQ